MGCGCKKKAQQRKDKIREENQNPELRRRREEQLVKLRESVKSKLNNFKRLSR
tara:strand:- start:3449 stop:3607 length:159 start_codon:yes stop_codon:yes gene_type:complete